MKTKIQLLAAVLMMSSIHIFPQESIKNSLHKQNDGIKPAVLLLSVINFFSEYSNEFILRTKTDGIKSVQINLEGDIEIYKSKDNTLKCEVEIIKKGDVWGASNKNSRAEYKLVAQKDNDELIIKPEQRADLWTIGVTNYKEIIKIKIYIPQHLRVKVLSKNSKLAIYSNFADLKIENKGSTSLTLNKIKIGELNCKTDGNKIEVNGQLRSTEYDFQSIGNENYSVISDKISLVLK